MTWALWLIGCVGITRGCIWLGERIDRWAGWE